MTREEAIKVLECELSVSLLVFGEKNDKETQDALKMAIEALKEMSAEEYRQMLMDVFHRTDHDELLTYVVMPKEEEFKSLEYILQKQPFMPRPHGEWVKRFDGNEWYWYCTSCKTQWYEEDLYMGGNEFPDFCPKCGADMRKKDG